MTFKQLLAAAKRAGYKGSDTDRSAVIDFLDQSIESGKFNFKIGGNALTRDALASMRDDEGGGTATAVEIDDDDDTTQRGAESKGKATPIDMSDEIKKIAGAMIDAEIRKLAIAPEGRPGAKGSGGGPDGEGRTPQVSVRSMAEVVFEANKAQCIGAGGKPIFETFEAARDFHADVVQQIVRQSDRAAPSQRDALIAGGKWSSERYVARGFAKKDEINTRTYATTPTGSGGAYTGVSYMPDIIKNVNQWGAALAYPRLVLMQDKETGAFKTSGDITVNYPDENGTSTSQKATPSNVSLRAHTGVMATKMSLQILQDSRIDLGMQVAEDFTRSIAKHLENCLFIGDGTATYAGMKGLITRLTDIGFGTAFGLVTGGGDMSAHAEDQLLECLAKIPDWARAGMRWYCNPSAVAFIFDRLGKGKGGVTWSEVQGMGLVMKYAGIPIVQTNAMNATKSTGTNTVDVILGDLSRGVLRGSRLDLQIEMDNSVGFLDYAVWMRAVDRHDIVVHEYGTSTAAGAYVALYQT